MRRRRRLASGLGGCAALLWGGAALAQFDGLPSKKTLDGGRVSVRLIPDVESIGPGQTFHLGVRFDIDKDWHMYWKNPGEGALPPEIAVTTPPGFTTGDVLWPRPVAIRTTLGPEYCYFDEVVLLVPITAPAGLRDSTVTLHADLRWTVCREVCLMGSAGREVTIRTSSRPTAPGGTNDRLAAFMKRLPKPLAGLQGAEVILDGGTLTVSGPAGGARRAAFFPLDGPGVGFGAADVTVGDGRFRVRVPVAIEPLNADGRVMTLGGLVTLGEKADDPSYDFRIKLDETLTLDQSEHR